MRRAAGRAVGAAYTGALAVCLRGDQRSQRWPLETRRDHAGRYRDMNAVSSISQIAGLMADPKRSAMLWALIDGRPRPTDELAMMAGLSSSSACAHLSLLSSAGLLRLEARGRKRYFRLATPQVGVAVEALASVQLASAKGRRTEVLQLPMSMRRARRCGDHLGGELAGELYHRLVVAGWRATSGS